MYTIVELESWKHDTHRLHENGFIIAS